MVKKGYKQTEVGVIPEDWDIKHLDDFGTIVGGGTPSTSVKEYWEGNIAWCTPSDITSTNGNYISKTERNITLKGIKYSAATMLPPRSILLCTRATIGELKISTIQMATNQGFKNVILNKSGSVEYLYYLLQTKISDMKELAIGSTFLEISKKSLCSILLQSPPLCEQQCIAKALSDMDSMISLLEKLIAKYKSIKAACLQQMFPQNGETVPRMRLPGFTDDWEQRKLDELCEIITKQTGFDYSATIKPALLTEKAEGVYSFIQNKDFTGNEINLDTDFYIPIEVANRFPKIILDKPSLLISISGRIGNVGFYNLPQKSFIGGAVGICKLKNLQHGGFIVQEFESDYGQRYFQTLIKASSHENITVEDIRNIPIWIPKDDREQVAIANYLRHFDNLITLQQRKLEKVQKIKQGMMQQLLTGKIRLV